MAYNFFPMISRMRYINRWGLMRNTRLENIQEHSHQVAVLAHALALIRRDVLGIPGAEPDRCAVAALYHDVSETLTGDMPTPIKYYNPDIKAAYKQVERIASERLLTMLPPELEKSYRSLIMEEEKDVEPTVKAADKLSAYIKCLEEQKAGNTEFDSAAVTTYEALKAMHMPELDWFLDNCMEAFTRNLDQL